MPEACLDNNQTANETRIAEFVSISYENKQHNSCNRSNSIDVSYIPLVNRNYAWPTKSDNALHCVHQSRQICTGTTFLSSTALGERRRFCCCSGNNSDSSCWRLKRRQIIWESAQASAQNRNEAIEVAATTSISATTSFKKTNALPPTTLPPPPPRSSDTLLITHNTEKYRTNITRHVNNISTSLPATPNLSQLRKPMLGGVQYQKLEAELAAKCEHVKHKTSDADLALKKQQPKNLQMTKNCSKLRAPTKFNCSNTNISNNNNSSSINGTNQTQMIIKRSVNNVIDVNIDNNNDEIKPHVNAVVRIISTAAAPQHVADNLQQQQHDALATISTQTQTDFHETINKKNSTKSSPKTFRKLCERCCEGAGSMSSNDCTSSKRNAEDAKHTVGYTFGYGDDYDAESGRFYRPAAESVSDELLSYHFVSDEEDLPRHDYCTETAAAIAIKTTNETKIKKPICRTLPAAETFIDTASLSFSSRSRSSDVYSVPLKAKTYEERLARSALLSPATAAVAISTPPPQPPPLPPSSLSSFTRNSPTICCYTTEKSAPPLPPANSCQYRATTANKQHKATLPIDIPLRPYADSVDCKPETIHAANVSTATNNSISNSLPTALSSSSVSTVVAAAAAPCLTDVSNPLKRRFLPSSLPTPPPPVPPKPKQNSHKHQTKENSLLDNQLVATSSLNFYDPSNFRRKVQKFEQEQTIIQPLTTTEINAVEFNTKLPQKFDFNNIQRQSLASTVNSRISSKSKTPEACELLNCFGSKAKPTNSNGYKTNSVFIGKDKENQQKKINKVNKTNNDNNVGELKQINANEESEIYNNKCNKCQFNRVKACENSIQYKNCQNNQAYENYCNESEKQNILIACENCYYESQQKRDYVNSNELKNNVAENYKSDFKEFKAQNSFKANENSKTLLEKRAYASEQQLAVGHKTNTGYKTRPRTLRYDSYGRLKETATTQLPTLQVTYQNGCKNVQTSVEVGVNENVNEGSDKKISILKSEPTLLPTRICVASSSAVNKLTPTLSRKLYAAAAKTTKTLATTSSTSIPTTVLSENQKETIKNQKVEENTNISKTKSPNSVTTTPTEIINDLQLQGIFSDFKIKHGLYEPTTTKTNDYKEQVPPNIFGLPLTPTNSTPTSPQILPSFKASSPFLLSNNSTPTSSLSPPLSTTATPFLATHTATTFNFNNKKQTATHTFIGPSLTQQQHQQHQQQQEQNFSPLWLSSETIASRSSDPASQHYSLDDQQSNCSDQTTIFHLDNDCCSASVTSSSSLQSSTAIRSATNQPQHQHHYQQQNHHQQPTNQLQHLSLRGPLIVKRIPAIQAFGYIPTHSHSLGSGANVRENGEKEFNMEKRRNTLERFQRLGFGRKSSPATPTTTPTATTAQQQDASGSTAGGSLRNRKSSEKSERLRELTELLRGNRSSPTPPPIPPPRKPRNGTQSASNSFEKTEDAATVAQPKTHSVAACVDNNVSTTTTITITSASATLLTQHLDGIQLMDQEELIENPNRPSTPSILDKPPKYGSDSDGRRSASPRNSTAAAASTVKPATSTTTTMGTAANTLKPNASLSSFESLMLMMGGREKSKSPPLNAAADAELLTATISSITDAKPVRSESRTFTGSQAQGKATPIRSASFSQIDSASGKFKRSALSVLRDRLRRDKAVESTSPTNSVLGGVSLPTQIPTREHNCNEVAKPKTEPDWIYIPLKQRTEMSINLNYGQDKSLEDVLESPDIIPEEDIFTTDTEQASSSVELRPQATASSVVASHAKMESLTDTIQSDNDFIIDCGEQFPVSIELDNLAEMTSKSEVIPSNLATLMEEQMPLESPPDNFLQTATTCLIPVPVYECAAQDWRLENPPQEWVEVAPEEFGIMPEAMQPLISIEQCAVAKTKTHNELRTENVPTISVSRSSEEADDKSILRRKDELTAAVTATTTTMSTAYVERRQASLDIGGDEVKKRYSHDDMDIGFDKQRVGNSSFDGIATRHSADERKRIDKSTRRKGMYIDNADWHDSPVVIPHGRGLALDISLVSFNAIKPEDSPDDCNIMYLNSPGTEYDNRTPGSVYPFDLNTPDSECSKPPIWSKAPPLTNFSCQSSEENEEAQGGNDSVSNVSVATKSPPGLTRHNNSYPFLRTDSISDNESDRTPPPLSREQTSPSPALSDFDFKRYSKRPLRGPYGQMLEAEMKKPNRMRFEEILEDLRGESESATLSRRQRVATTASSSTATLPDDAENASISSSNNNRNTPQYSNSMRVRKTNTYLPVPAHTRAASTPSQMENVSNSNISITISNSKSGGGSVDKINPHDKRHQSSCDNSTTTTLTSSSSNNKHDKDKDSTCEKGTLGVDANNSSSCQQQPQSQSQPQNLPHHHIHTQSTHQNNHHSQREMKRAASEAPATKTHHSKRTQSMSGAGKAATKSQQQQHQQKPSLDGNNPKSTKNATTAAKIKPSQELLAELLQGSSEKLLSEQRQQMFADTRTHVVQEIFRNEQSYVEALQTIVNKYFKVLKSPEHAGMIDTRTVDEIFFMVPDILEIHETFLAGLKSRLDNWNTQQKVGDCFMETFSKLEVLEVYTSFVNNCNRAKNSIRATKHQRPSFSKFLETTAREHKGKLTLDYLLIKPVQKFPNYELLFQRLIKHTDHDHPDQKHLQDALKLVHDILVHINCKEREILENGQREATLRELEGIIEGITDLSAPDRQFLLFDLVSMPAGQGPRKERGFFLFNDLLVLTSIKKRTGTIRKPNTISCPSTVASTLDTNKYKFLTKISLDCLEIIKPKDENIKRIICEITDLAGDCNKLQQISDITTTLSCPHDFLEDCVRDLHCDLQRQLSERQTHEAQLNLLELSVNSPNGSQKQTIVFSNPEKRTQWEETFNIAKQKLAATLERHPIPEYLTSIPIRKTRAGLQFTCASATLSEKRDVWVCNSDGYVGQVCIMSLYPEPNVTSCNGVCNARILCVASVPAYSSNTVQQSQRTPTTQNQSYTQQLRDYRKSISPNCQPANTLGGGNGVGSNGTSNKNNSTSDINKNSDIKLDLNLSSSDDEADAAVAAAAAAAAPSENTVGSVAQQIERVPSPAPAGNPNKNANAIAAATTILSHGHQDSNSEEGDGNQSTMWIGTEDGCIHVYNSTDNIRIKKNRIKIEHQSAVYSILYLENRVFVSLANGDICVYLREGVGGWNTSSSHCLSIGTVKSPVTKLLNVNGKLWCSIQGIIKVIDIETLLVINQIQISSDSKPITNMTVSHNYVWISIQNSAHIKCFHSKSHQLVTEVNLAPAVNKMLSNCDEIIRQHKAACLRVTSLLSCKDLIWIGTSAGVLLTIPAKGYAKLAAKATAPAATTIVPTGIPHGHTGHVRFITFVETLAESPTITAGSSAEGSSDVTLKAGSRVESSNEYKNQGSSSKRSSRKEKNKSGNILIISGGDGYEDFRNSGANSLSEIAGREDSTNHLLIWQI